MYPRARSASSLRSEIAGAASGFGAVVKRSRSFLDAFSGDSIPVHLLTEEAFGLYREHLADGGVLAVHISNRYLDLRSVVAGAAEANGMHALVRRDQSDGEETGSWWMAVAVDPSTLDRLTTDDRWHPGDEAGSASWTDERSNLLSVLGTD